MVHVIVHVQTLTYGRGPPGPVVSGVLRTHDGVVKLWPNAMLRLRKAATLPKSPVHSPASRSLEGQAVAQKVEFFAALRNLSIAFGHIFTTPSCVRSTPFTTDGARRAPPVS